MRSRRVAINQKKGDRSIFNAFSDAQVRVIQSGVLTFRKSPAQIFYHLLIVDHATQSPGAHDIPLIILLSFGPCEAQHRVLLLTDGYIIVYEEYM